MESVFHISNCAVENQVKFATCTFLGNVTWWKSHMKTVTQDVAYAMDWKALNKMMTVKYCPRGRMILTMESEEDEKYVGGLPDMEDFLGKVMSYQPSRWRKCNKCKKIGHKARDYRSSGPNGNNNNRGKFGTTQNVVTCYECGVQGHFKKDCPKLKNGNRGNQCGNGNSLAKVYVVDNAGTNPDSNVVTGTEKKQIYTKNEAGTRYSSSTTESPDSDPFPPFLLLEAQTQIGISAMVIENKVKTLTITTFLFQPSNVLVPATLHSGTTYDVIPPSQVIIALPAIVPPPMSDSRSFFPPNEISSPEGAKTPVESPNPMSTSSSVGASSPVRWVIGPGTAKAKDQPTRSTANQWSV
ncbi:putative reverse transcriptase domain-containing protein [Tanacetum coccineum]|uniref:Reverse transcriptase domain-containing protein n=1 Tax=Tanacetum coccineum TaxID=301880 RepID=A0ABQ4YX06_9ASTR